MTPQPSNIRTFIIHLVSSVAHGLIWIIPVYLAGHPDIAGLTVSGIGSLVVSWISKKVA